MSRQIDDFFYWYSSQTGVSEIPAQRFTLKEVESGQDSQCSSGRSCGLLGTEEYYHDHVSGTDQTKSEAQHI
jgi:hypothetical protein